MTRCHGFQLYDRPSIRRDLICDTQGFQTFDISKRRAIMIETLYEEGEYWIKEVLIQDLEAYIERHFATSTKTKDRLFRWIANTRNISLRRIALLLKKPNITKFKFIGILSNLKIILSGIIIY